MNPLEQPKQEITPQNAITKPSGIENIELVPMKVTDLRDSRYLSFDLNKFVTTIGRLRNEGLYKLSREFQDSEYGKYMSTGGSSESNSWNEAIQEAKAIEITASTDTKTFGMEHREGRTQIEVKVLMSGNAGRVFTFNFHRDGTYSNANWDNVHLQKRLRNEANEEDFVLDTNEEPKKLE